MIGWLLLDIGLALAIAGMTYLVFKMLDKRPIR